MGAVRGTDAVKQSGIALQTEFQMLNSKLSEKADILELAEEQLWAFYCNWQGHNTHEVTISYPDSFDLRDYESELRFLQQAKASGVPSNTFVKEVDKRIADLVLDDEHLNESHKEIEQQARPTGQFVTATDVATNGQA